MPGRGRSSGNRNSTTWGSEESEKVDMVDKSVLENE